MSKTATPAAPAAPAFEIEDYTPVPSANEYAAHVTALIEAGPGKSGKIVVPAADLATAKRRFAEAANAQDKTARTVSKDENEDGTVTLRFALIPRVKQNRKPKGETDAAPVEEIPDGESVAE